MMDSLSIGGVLSLRDELLRSLVDRCKVGDLEALREARKLLKDQGRDIVARDRRQRQQEVFRGAYPYAGERTKERIHNDNGNG